MDQELCEVGKRIRQVRDSKNLSQADLADLIHISASHMSNIENGKTNWNVLTLIHLSEALKTSPAKLLRTDIQESVVYYSEEVAELMSDCNPTEARILLRTLQTMKQELIASRKTETEE